MRLSRSDPLERRAIGRGGRGCVVEEVEVREIQVRLLVLHSVDADQSVVVDARKRLVKGTDVREHRQAGAEAEGQDAHGDQRVARAPEKAADRGPEIVC